MHIYIYIYTPSKVCICIYIYIHSYTYMSKVGNAGNWGWFISHIQIVMTWGWFIIYHIIPVKHPYYVGEVENGDLYHMKYCSQSGR